MLVPRRSVLAALLAAPLASSRALAEPATFDGVPRPVIDAPLESPPDPPSFDRPYQDTATPAAERIVAQLRAIHRDARRTSYEHRTRVDERTGLYAWDCSGMTAWLLERCAPTARRALRVARPVARDFARTIANAQPDPATRAARRSGWQRIDRALDARPGDVFAWQRPRGLPSRNSGHVGFLIHAPLPIDGMPGALALRVADSTSIPHQLDSRSGAGDDGFGIGTLVILTDEHGTGTHYGWAGTRSRHYVTTRILFGRTLA